MYFLQAYFCPIASTYRLQHAYNVHNFYAKTIWYSYPLGDNHKFIVNVKCNIQGPENHQNALFFAKYKHSNVAFNIQH